MHWWERVVSGNDKTYNKVQEDQFESQVILEKKWFVWDIVWPQQRFKVFILEQPHSEESMKPAVTERREKC